MPFAYFGGKRGAQAKAWKNVFFVGLRVGEWERGVEGWCWTKEGGMDVSMDLEGALDGVLGIGGGYGVLERLGK